MKLVVLLTLSLLVVGCYGVCSNPSVRSQTYSTSDSLMSTETVFIVEVEVECEGSESLSLHALVEDQLLPVAKSIGANKFQLSWTSPHENAKSGRRTINFYDEAGSTAIRKALRYGEEASATPLFSVDLDHKRVRIGMSVAPSFIAVVVSMLVWWLAYAAKGKLQE